MKKLLMCLMFLLVSISTFADTKYFKTSLFCLKVTGYEWSAWKPSNINVDWDLDRRRITIHSKEVQIIDYITLEQTSDLNSATLYGDATDSNYKTIKLLFTVYESKGVFLTIMYDDLAYMYKLESRLNERRN